MFRIICDCGQYLARTHLSHQTGGRDIDYLASKMARQLGISLPVFQDIVGCSRGRRDYLDARGHHHG